MASTLRYVGILVPAMFTLAACSLVAIAAPKASSTNPASWVWVAAVAPKDQPSATLAIAKAHIQAVFTGSHAVGLYFHPADRQRAIAVLKADAARHHYKVDFGETQAGKSKGRPRK